MMIKLNFNNDVLTLTTDCSCVVASGSLYQEADQVCEHNDDACHCRKRQDQGKLVVARLRQHLADQPARRVGLAAGLRQGGRIFLCGLAAAGIWSLVLLIRRGIARQRLTYLVFYLYRFALGGSVEPYYLEARDGKEASFCLAPCLFLGVIGAELIRYL